MYTIESLLEGLHSFFGFPQLRYPSTSGRRTSSRRYLHASRSTSDIVLRRSRLTKHWSSFLPRFIPRSPTSSPLATPQRVHQREEEDSYPPHHVLPRSAESPPSLPSDQHPKPPNLPKQTTEHGSLGGAAGSQNISAPTRRTMYRLWILLMADNSVADGMVPSASSTTLSFDEEHAWKPTGMESNAIILLRFRGFDPICVVFVPLRFSRLVVVWLSREE